MPSPISNLVNESAGLCLCVSVVYMQHFHNTQIFKQILKSTIMSSIPSDWQDSVVSRPVSVDIGEEKINWFDWLVEEIANDNVTIKIKVVKCKSLVKGKCRCKIPNYTCEGTWVYPATGTIFAKLANDPQWVPCKSLIFRIKDILLRKLDIYKVTVVELTNFGVDLKCDVEQSVRNTHNAIWEMNERRLFWGLDAAFITAPERPQVDEKYYEKFKFETTNLNAFEKIQWFDWLRNEIQNRRLTIKLTTPPKAKFSGDCVCALSNCRGRWMKATSMAVWSVLDDDIEWIPCLELIETLKNELQDRQLRHQQLSCLFWHFGIGVPQRKALDKFNTQAVLKLAKERLSSSAYVKGGELVMCPGAMSTKPKIEA